MKQNRVDRIMAALKEMGLHQMLIVDPMSIYYLTGVYVSPFERFYGLYLREDGHHAFFLNRLFTVPQEVGIEKVWYSDTDPAMEIVAKYLDKDAPLGVDKELKARFLLPLILNRTATDAAVSRLVQDIFYVRRQQLTDGNICSSDVWRQISDAQSAVGKLKRKRERCRMERLKFIGKRLVYLVIMLFGVATLVFILTKLVPGDPVTANLSQRALGDPQIVAAYKAKYGLDQPIIVQYVYYMKNLLHFDLGTSIRTNNAVLSELARCYPATIELAVFAIILATLFGILFGVISAIKRNSILDQIVRAISVTGVSLPSFWFALLVLYFFYYKLQILPGPGRLGNAFSAPQTVTGFFVIDSLLEGDIPKALDALRHLILPGTVLAAFTMGLITRTTRSNLLDVMSTDYIRTARAKGLSNVRLIIHHALGNALIPVLTVIGLGFGNLLGGMVLVETIFNWPGVGQFAYQSVLSNDYPSIIGVALLIALNYMIINTVVDILYGIIDPRVRCS